MGFVALPKTPANPARTWIFFVLINPEKLGNVGFRIQLTWFTCCLCSLRLAVFQNAAKTQIETQVEAGYQYQRAAMFIWQFL